MGNYDDFRRADDVEDRRLENHHRPLSWQPGLPRDEVRWTELGHQLGLTNIENQITDNQAKLATSPLAEALGRNDLGSSLYIPGVSDTVYTTPTQLMVRALSGR